VEASTSHLGAEIGPQGDVLVIFGITGDLAKKMTLQSLYRLELRGAIDVPIIGVARNDWSHDDLKTHVREAVQANLDEVDEAVLTRLEDRLSYVQGDYADKDTYERLRKQMGKVEHPVFYLEIPPSLFAEVVTHLGDAGLTEGGRVVLEKPFGDSLESARALQSQLREVLAESQIYRIDHFLGKEPVMDIIYLRFANSILEPVWQRGHVDSVQITMSEDFGVEDRGSFYDSVGTVRDVVQNHLLQLMALIGMEAPSAAADPDPIRDRKLDFFKSVHAADPGRFVRGQYEGYTEIEGVAPGSTTETFAALRLECQNWRWAGVPFFIRAGKAMAAKVTEIRVVLESPPPLGIGGFTVPTADEFIFRIDPAAGACLLMEAKQPGEDELRRVHLDLLFAEQVGEQPTPYERLLSDAMRGNPELFSRMDMVEETWRIVQPLIDEPSPIETYPKGGWGPDGSAHLTAGYGGWRKPWLPDDVGPFGPVGAA
jgi:glucose-6-phosphate 1-dehydrogenase